MPGNREAWNYGERFTPTDTGLDLLETM